MKIYYYESSGDLIQTNSTLSARDRIYTSESDVCGRQILTYKDGTALEEFKYFWWS